jgi:predicted nucleic acid-binding protein
MRALIDSDVLIAALDGSVAQSPASIAAINAAIRGEYEGFITPLIAANVMYALRRKWKNAKLPDWEEKVNAAMARMLPSFGMISVNRTDFMASIESNFKDKEDGIQYFAALRSRIIDLIITCNTADFVGEEMPAINPGRIDDHL